VLNQTLGHGLFDFTVHKVWFLQTGTGIISGIKSSQKCRVIKTRRIEPLTAKNAGAKAVLFS
jgi:hypothetical protein